MFTEEDLRISNKSYINKDFASIYPELIEFIQNETNRWDPETSTETDPGIVLTKVMAFVADKLNYNIDKNALEDFIVSCTQESSMRKLCDMMGYSMKYFVAPTTVLTLTYVGELELPITFEALDTTFTSTDTDINVGFIATRSVTLSRQNDVQTCPVIQGALRELRVNTSGTVTSESEKPLIQLNNLDDNNRVYFPETNVAENGVFILDSTLTGDFWTAKRSLNDVEPLTKCFKFGYDSTRELPYIEFPEDIASLIGNGLYIRYVLTSGYDGNVSANLINALDSTTSESWSYLKSQDDEAENNLYVRNYSAASNGKNPESINEAYNGFKKTIGTFDTLVTCRDYSNAIYNSLDADGVFPLVSNVQVSDRRNDVNYSKRVVSYDELGEVIINVTDASDLNAYQLCCYPLSPIYAYTDTNQYDNSFLPLTKTGRTITSEIANDLERYKTISHDYKILEPTDIYAIKNKLTLDCGLIPTYKVTSYEALEIDMNVIYKLIEDFNAREVDYGYKIPNDSLYESIMSADKRINYVSLPEPKLETFVMTRNSNEIKLLSEEGVPYYTHILAKNILNGNVALFDYDNRFNYELGQKKISGKNMINEEIKSISTDLTLQIEATSGNPGSENLYKNEAVQFIAPNVITNLTIPAYCYFRFTNSTHDKNNPISSNTVYELTGSETLYIGYTQNDEWVVDKYVAPQIIKPVGFDLFVTPDTWDKSTSPAIYGRSAFEKTNEADPDQTWFYSLDAKESIEMMKVNKVVIKDTKKCYWLRNNSTNRLFTEDEWDDSTETGSAILKENEYFFYTDAAETQLMSFGSGTTIISDLSSLENVTADVVDISDILESGMLALKDKWKVLSFSSARTMTVQENNILTLTEGDTIIVDEGSLSIDKDLSPVDAGTRIRYSIDGASPERLPIMSISEGGWQVRSRLHINVTRDESQIINDGLEGSSSSRQSVTFTLKDDSEVTLDTSSQHFNLNTELHSEGGVIDTVVMVKTISENVATYPVTMYCYTIALQSIVGDPQTPERNLEGYASEKLTGSDTFVYTLPTIELKGEKENGILMIYVYKTGGSGTISLQFDNSATYECKQFNSTGSYYPAMNLIEGINVVDLHRLNYDVVTTMSIINNGIQGSLVIGTLDFYSGLNDSLGIDSFVKTVNNPNVTKADIEESLMDAIREDKFYYNCKIDNAKVIESDDLSSPLAFYDANNVMNAFTISQINFKDSKIDVMKTSLK